MLDGKPLDLARLELGMTMQRLWGLCLALGGSLSLGDLSTYLGRGGSRSTIRPVEHDVITHVLNEALIDRGLEPTLGYSTP